MRSPLFGFPKELAADVVLPRCSFEARDSGLAYANNLKPMTVDGDRPAEEIASCSELFIPVALADSQ